MKTASRPRILVIRGGAIGDFILTLPTIQLIRQQILGAHVEVLGYGPIVEIAQATGLAESTRNLEHGSMAKLFIPNAQLDEELQLYLRSFNVIVSYLYDPDGYLRDNMKRLDVRTYLELPHRVDESRSVHAADQLAQPLEKLAMFLESPTVKLRFLEPVDLGNEPVIAIHPGSGSTRKNWPLSQWILLAKYTVRSLGKGRIVWICGEAEYERGTLDALKAHPFTQDQERWEQLSLPQLGARLAHCSAFLGHDSGISHLAAASGTPCCLFFGPTKKEVWAPRESWVRVYEEPTGDLHLLSLETAAQQVKGFFKELQIG